MPSHVRFRVRGMLQGARHASGCEAMPSHVRFRVRGMLQGARRCHRTYEACHRTCDWAVRDSSQPQHGISLACHRMIDRAHEVHIGCEACHRTCDWAVRDSSDYCSGARGGFRVRGMLPPQRHSMPVALATSAWNLLGLPSDDRWGARGGFRVRGDAIARNLLERAIGMIVGDASDCRAIFPSPQRGCQRGVRATGLIALTSYFRLHASDFYYFILPTSRFRLLSRFPSS